MTDTPHIQTQLALIEDSQAPAPNPDDSKKADARRGSPGHILKLRAGYLNGKWAPQHERRHIDGREIDAQSVRAGLSNRIRPFPVGKGPTGYALVDGSTLIAAIADADPKRLVPAEEVSDSEALCIRSQDNATRSHREPMAKARRALILRRSGMTNSEIASELRIAVDIDPDTGRSMQLTDARVSQLCDAAITEERFSGLADIVENPATIPVSFWERMARTLRGRCDTAADDSEAAKAARVDEFHKEVQGLIAKRTQCEEKFSLEEVTKDLNLHKPRNGDNRARKIGVRSPIAGTDQYLYVARDRAGGMAVNLPTCLSEKDKDHVVIRLHDVVREIILQQRAAQSD